MDKYNKKIRQFYEALVMERFKERLIKGGRLLTEEEAKEVFNRTLELCSAGEYKPDPDLERYLNRRWLDDVDINDPKALIEALKESQIEKERLRMKFIKERELAEIKASNPDEP